MSHTLTQLMKQDLLARGPLQEIRLSLTTNCNLRCVYCAVSQSSYVGAEMPQDMVRRLTSFIKEVSRKQMPAAVHVNGHGETTFIARWVDRCRPLLDAGVPVAMTTNLSKVYSEQEFETLARMDLLMISLDTADPDLLRRMRRNVNLQRMLDNIAAIRSVAVRMKSRPPRITFSCGLYDQNSLVIEDLARLAVAGGVESVGFWNLTQWDHERFPYDQTDVAPGDRAYPLRDLKPSDLRPRIEAIKSAAAILRDNGIRANFNGNFVDVLAESLDGPVSESETVNSKGVSTGVTRHCLDPWRYMEVAPDGNVRPCCARPPIGNIANADLDTILNGDSIRGIRENLLSGTLDHECASCLLRPLASTETLGLEVRALFRSASPAKMALHTVWEWLRSKIQLRTRIRRWYAGADKDPSIG